MAGPSPDIDWLEIFKWGVPIVFYAGVTWGAYKSLKAKQAEDSIRIDQLERRVAGGVRRQDIDNINRRIDDNAKATSEKLDLILEIVKAR